MNVLVEAFLNKEKISAELEQVILEEDEREKAWALIEEIAHYKLLKIILDKLEEKDQEMMLDQMHSAAPEIFIENLREKIENVEMIIKEELLTLEKEIIEDIRQL